ncbi:MAG: DMT family transporter [Alphaproteobacteria bacterium]|nr:DMT family transporter [Alphaproteobacteria bacterium]
MGVFGLVLPTALAMLAFAANSVFARVALASGEADALGYTGIRLVSGALVLVAIRRARRTEESDLWRGPGGSWAGAAALFGYAIAFSLAYLMLDAGSGALILFASVQIGMLGWAIVKGDRPGPPEWLGFAIAFAAMVVLMSPGITAPAPLGAGLMAAAGFAWAAYSLLGRGSAAPLADTAGNFARCLPVGAALALAGMVLHPPSAAGLAYAIASGALASGLGYAVWYAVLPRHTRSSAAFVQLTVPAIAAVGGVLFIGEPLTLRLGLASAGILGGVALALVAAERRRASAGRAA